MNISNHVFTVVFAIEMVLKVLMTLEEVSFSMNFNLFSKGIASGFMYGPDCYFSDNWNRMDGTLVIISLVDTSVTAIVGKKSKIFGMLRVFRLVRALKPLRVINRAPGIV